MKRCILRIAVLLFIFTNCSAKDKVAITTVKTVISISNLTESDRNLETIELDWSKIATKGFKAGKTIVRNAKGEEIPSQIIYDANNEAKYLLFQTQLKSKTQKKFSLEKGQPKAYATQAYVKIAPERYNDILWENDKIAFRLFHADLIPIDGPSGGLDIWSKRTHEMVIKKWLGHMDYHNDHGLGCDFYKVGPTLGAGGISILEDGKMMKHSNYIKGEIIAQGPIRVIAEISFPEQSIKGKPVTMTKKISFDAGSSFTKFDVTFSSELKDLPLVTGIHKRDHPGNVCMDEANGCLTYWEPEQAPHGHQGLAIILPEAATMGTLENHLVAYGHATANKPFTYYSGACWDIAGYYTTPKQWKAYINTYKQQLKTPLKITVD